MFGSCVTLLVGRHVDWKVQSHGLIRKLKLRLLRKKIRDFYILGLCPLVGRKKNDWLFWGKGEKKKNGENFPKYFSGRGLCLTHVWAPCCERTKSYLRRWASCCEWTWVILSRTLFGAFTYVYTRGLLAVEYLAKLCRILWMFSKSFKAIILGFNFI